MISMCFLLQSEDLGEESGENIGESIEEISEDAGGVSSEEEVAIPDKYRQFLEEVSC